MGVRKYHSHFIVQMTVIRDLPRASFQMAALLSLQPCSLTELYLLTLTHACLSGDLSVREHAKQ